MQQMIRFFFLILFISLVLANGQKAKADEAILLDMHSPSGAIGASFGIASGGKSSPFYSIKFKNNILIDRAVLGLQTDIADLSQNLRLDHVNERDEDTQYKLPFGKNSSVQNRFREYEIILSQISNPQIQLTILFRLYDDGVAFRYLINKQNKFINIKILSEATQITPLLNPTIYALPLGFGSAYEEPYLSQSFTNLPVHQNFGLPMVMLFGSDAFVSIAEANLHDYPQSYLQLTNGKDSLFFQYPTLNNQNLPVHKSSSLETPWRVFMIGSSAKAVLESNLITNLSEPAVNEDVSWIHPGKVLFQWWNGYVMPGERFDPPESVLNTRTLKKHIDFCAKFGIEYFSLDGYEFEKAWYGGSISPYAGQDVTKSAPDINLPEVFQYAKSKGVRARIWLITTALTDENMDHILQTYASWGAAGIMVDFMGDDTQAGSAHVELLLKTALKYKLTVAFHGIPKPTGFARTYPNYLTQEGVMGQEYNKWPGKNSTPDHEVNIAFIRGTVGPMDTHEGAFRPVPFSRFKAKSIAPNSIGTLARQLAMYVVYENEQPMLADYPEAYEAHLDAFSFLQKVPVTWDETLFVSGSLEQKFITIARRSGQDWYMGSLTGQQAHSEKVSLAFLGEGKFLVEKYADTKNSAVNGESIEVSRNEVVTAKDFFTVTMAPAGGQAVRFRRLP